MFLYLSFILRKSKAVILQRDSKRVALHNLYIKRITNKFLLMQKQSINDQLELLRLKELFMSDIKIRSKMTDLISSDNERTDFKKFCEFTHCEPRIAKMLSQL